MYLKCRLKKTCVTSEMAPAVAVENPFDGALFAFIFTVIIFIIVVLVVGGAHGVIRRLICDKESPVLLFAIVINPPFRSLPHFSVDFVLRV
jgi:hypothetical protein